MNAVNYLKKRRLGGKLLFLGSFFATFYAWSGHLLGKETYKSLFPSSSDRISIEIENSAIAKNFAPCFLSAKDRLNQSGYSILEFSDGTLPSLPRLVSSTYKNAFVENCIIDKSKDVMGLSSTRDWRYVHLLSFCNDLKEFKRSFPRGTECKVVVEKNNSPTVIEAKAVVDGHWSAKKGYSNAENEKAEVFYFLLDIFKNRLL